MIWERVLISLDSSVCGLYVSGLEGRLAYDECVNDDSKRPDIDLVGMAGSSFKYLRCDIVGSTANGSLLFTVEIQLCG